jgi:formylglycine-generating enzyme required for sulfatase activity
MGQEHKGSSASVAFFQSLSWKAGQLGVIGGFSDRHVFTAPVGSYPANGHGIHDLGGNVWEWCEDKHSSGYGRVLRGGSWYAYDRDNLASSYRDYFTPVGRFSCGFRCVVVR